MTQSEARIYVLSHEITVLRGLRIGPNISVAEAAVQREREVEREISAVQSKLPPQNAIPDEDDERPVAVNFSLQPLPGKEGK